MKDDAEQDREHVVAKPIPTTVGDVLILHTERNLTIYLIGVVTADGQHDFAGGEIVRSEPTPEGALAAGKRLLAPGRRIFMHHLDTREWLELVYANQPCERERPMKLNTIGSGSGWLASLFK